MVARKREEKKRRRRKKKEEEKKNKSRYGTPFLFGTLGFVG